MEKPFRYKKKFHKVGNSVGVVIPKMWVDKYTSKFKEADKIEIIMELYKNKIVITPLK